MALYNFGMLSAGLPDPSQRMASTVAASPNDQRNAWMADWQSRYDAAAPIVREGQTSSEWNWTGTPDAQTAFLLANGADPSVVATAYGNYKDTSTSPYVDDSARRALTAEKNAYENQYGAAASAYAQNQTVQQNAYNAAGGGSYLGGTINGSYSAPQTPLDPNSSLYGLMNQAGVGLGFGGPNGSASQAGFGFTAGMMGQQPSGWGGPFTNRNPWSAS